jgi:hypothetical protein
MKVSSFRCAAVALLIAACSSNPAAPVNEEFRIDIGETVDVDGTSLAITFVKVNNDSRCPMNAICVWEGNAQIQLAVRDNGAAVPLVLNTTQEPRQIVAGSYRIELLSLQPFPVVGETRDPDDYYATLVVRRSNVVCTAEARAALSVSLTDSLTGASTFTNVTVVASEGQYADSVKLAVYPDAIYSTSIPLAYERRGTYNVQVRAAGYAPWIKNGVVVSADECHVTPVALTARLVR